MSHEKYLSVIEALNQCAMDCFHCADACLEERNPKDLARCIRLDQLCADTCLFTTRLLAVDSELSADALNLCAKACDLCAKECEKHSKHMDHCRECAESCRDCAEECRSVAQVNV